MTVLSVIFILVVAFLAGMEGVLDEFQFHQPIVACVLIGLATGHLSEGLILGGSLQLIALGWMNIGAAVAPDAALASVASAILVCTKGSSVELAITLAIPLAVAGLVLTIFIRSLTIGILHVADRQAAKGSFRGVEICHLSGLFIQGLRIAVPAGIILSVPVEAVTTMLNSIPAVITGGLGVAGGFIVAVGYAMVINMMATRQIWPFFFIGFALAAITQLNLIAFGVIGVALALIFISLSPDFRSGEDMDTNTNSQNLDAILEDF